MTAQLAPLAVQKFFDNNGAPLAFGLLTTYAAGTTNKIASYVDSTQTTPNTNPVQLNFRGECALWLDPTLTYKIALTDQSGNQIPGWPVDNIPGGISQNAIGAILYPRTPAEIAASVTPVNFSYAPGVVDRYGTNTNPGTTDMSGAVQNAVKIGGDITFLGTTYLFAGVSLTQSVVFQGQGDSTVLLTKAAGPSNQYSSNLFTDTAALAYVTFKDLVLNGACSVAGSLLNAWNTALVQLTQTTKIRFENASFTGYSASAFGVGASLTAQFFYAICIRNATQVDFVNVTSAENYFEQIDVYFAPGVDGKANFERCSLINSAGGTADHTFIEVTGGHTVITSAFVLNNRNQSCININVPLSAHVSKCRFINEVGAAGQTIAINVGQDTFPYNNNVLIEGNYSFNKSELVAISQGQNQIIRDNIAVHSTVQPIECVSGLSTSALVSGASSYTNVLPAYAAFASFPAVALPTLNLVIEGNEIQGCSGNFAVTLRTLQPAAAFWFQYVNVNDNILATDTGFSQANAIHFADCDNINIERNFLGYGGDGIFCDQTAANVNIVENTFTSVQATASDDIVFNAFAPTNVVVRGNTFTNYPRQGAFNVDFFSGLNLGSGALILDNIGMKPTAPVFSTNVTDYVIRNTKLKRVTAAPSTGDWGLGDVVFGVPATGTAQEYDCTSYGSLGTALSGVTFSGTIGAFSGTVTAGISQLRVGMGISIAGSSQQCILTLNSGTGVITFHQALPGTVTNAAVSLLPPTFHAAANFA